MESPNDLGGKKERGERRTCMGCVLAVSAFTVHRHTHQEHYRAPDVHRVVCCKWDGHKDQEGATNELQLESLGRVSSLSKTRRCPCHSLGPPPKLKSTWHFTALQPMRSSPFSLQDTRHRTGVADLLGSAQLHLYTTQHDATTSSP